MKGFSGWIFLGSLAALILLAVIVLSMRPAKLQPMDSDVIAKNPLPMIKDETLAGATRSSLPILAEQMPDFTGISKWWNTTDGKPHTASDLRGKVVMVDFWTYSCINCIRTQPFMRKIWETYKDDGLVIIGVHTPEFAFEKVPSNVEEAIRKAKLEYPIALDAEYGTWNAYSNRYWPAAYFFDRQGRLRFTHFGEGEYDEQEEVIRELLREGGALADQPTGVDPTPKFELTKTHETYFGYHRLENFTNSDELQADTQTAYTLREVRPDSWSIGGKWSIGKEYASSLVAGSRFRMNIESDAMHLVLGSMDGEKRIRVSVDGTVTRMLRVKNKELYTVAEFPNAGRHTIEIEILDGGVEFYAATFGMIVSACTPERLAVSSDLNLGAALCTP